MIIFLLLAAGLASYQTLRAIKFKRYLKSDKIIKDQEEISTFNKAFASLLKTKAYISSQDMAFYQDYQALFGKVKKDKRLHKLEVFKNFILNFEHFFAIVKKNNELFIKEELKTYEDLLSDIDGKSLDLQQRRAVVIDDTNNLVLAGAGSGKTLTIAAKVKYLTTKGIKARDILLISFTKKSAEEMKERVQRLGIDISVKTFHKLGLDIIVSKYDRRPDIQSNLGQVIDDYFKTEVYQNKNYIYTLLEFFAYYMQIPKEVSDFDSLQAYHEYKLSLDYETMTSKARQSYVHKGSSDMRQDKETYKKETVKSYEELTIANFLFLHGVKYEYERLYPYRSDKFKKPYRTDFYLVDYDIYLEHFGIDENNQTPQYSEVESKKYLADMEWKRGFHQENQTTLIETYSYMNKKGQLIKHLDKLLKSHGVVYKEVDRRQVFESVFNYSENRYFMDFKKLISTFINLFKSMGYDGHDFVKLDKSVDTTSYFLAVRSRLFFRIARPIYDHYQASLRKEKAIDFNDMINLSTDIVKKGSLALPYKYIIIDEYQDISQARYKLIKAIKDQTKAKLLCVGDDWQSIYRFAGSDISLFTCFEDYFGQYSLSKIEKTYRNSQELINLAGDFVLKNKKQLKKSLKSDKHEDQPIEVVAHSGDRLYALKYTLDKIVQNHGQETDIMLIGRNNFDVNFLRGADFTIDQSIQYKKYPKLDIHFMSAHRSKGLEASHVIIVNGDNNKLGFPNKISDDPVLSYVLTGLEAYSFAEERRLFYVALTRTKNKTYILSRYGHESTFVNEIKASTRFNQTLVDQTVSNLKCPKCLVGSLIERHAASKSFVGCSSYPSCDFTLASTSVLRDPKRCGCGGFLIKRTGTYGEFYGCSNYPICEYKEKI